MLLEALSRKAEPAYQEIKKRLEQSEVVGSDETGCYVKGKIERARFLPLTASTLIPIVIIRRSRYDTGSLPSIRKHLRSR
ncbi:MAG: hypothetical protein LBT14_06735 [Treponema sp.]|nr:hypothetical protein [Treponema sp.]